MQIQKDLTGTCNEKTAQLLQLLAGLLRRKGGNTERKEKQMTEDGKGLVLVLKNKTTKKETEKNSTIKPLPRQAGLISVFALLLPKPPHLTVSVHKQLRMPRVNSPPTSPSANKLFTLGVYLLLSLGLQPRNLFRLHCSSFLGKGRTPQITPGNSLTSSSLSARQNGASRCAGLQQNNGL